MREPLKVIRIGNSKGIVLPAYWHKKFDVFSGTMELSDRAIKIEIIGKRIRKKEKKNIKESEVKIPDSKNKKKGKKKKKKKK